MLGRTGAVTAALADILTRRVPLEISKYLAKEIFAQLVDEMREGSPDDENTPPQSTSSSMMGDGSHAAFPRVMTTPNLHQGPWDTNATQDTSCVTPPTRFMRQNYCAFIDGGIQYFQKK